MFDLRIDRAGGGLRAGGREPREKIPPTLCQKAWLGRRKVRQQEQREELSGPLQSCRLSQRDPRRREARRAMVTGMSQRATGPCHRLREFRPQSPSDSSPMGGLIQCLRWSQGRSAQPTPVNRSLTNRRRDISGSPRICCESCFPKPSDPSRLSGAHHSDESQAILSRNPETCLPLRIAPLYWF